MLSGGIRKCKSCSGDGHTAFTCPSKPRKTLQAKKRLSKRGKLAKAYTVLRETYFDLHPGDEHYCYYCLYIGVELPLTKKQAQVEHFLSKARHPELRFDMTNIVVACGFHNKEKGSLNGPEYLQKLDKEVEK